MDTDTLEIHTNSSEVRLHVHTEILIGALIAVVVGGSAWAATSNSQTLAWLFAVQLIYVVRLIFEKKYATKSAVGSRDHSANLGLGIGLGVTGCAWGGGCAALLALYPSAWFSLGAVLALPTLAAIVVACNFGRRAFTLPFLVSSFVPAIVVGFITPGASATVFAISGCILLGAFAMAAHLVGALADAFSEQAIARSKFATIAKESKRETRRLELNLKTSETKLSQLERELGEASSDLAVTKGKADALSNALERVSPYDTKTGLLNAKKYENVIEREWARMKRQELPITLVHMQIDNFDGYEETYGKLGYETAIRRISELTKKTGTRPGDVVARLDENKIAILLPEADHKNGETLANVLRQQIRRLNIPNMHSSMHSAVTASFGTATVIPNSDLTIEQFKARADDALYEAQFQGGDKVVRFRTMQNVRLERWDHNVDGELSTESLVRKLSILGYQTREKTFRPGEYLADRRAQIDTIDAIVAGILKVSMEGEEQVLKPGDCLYIPKGHVTSIEVVGEQAVLCLEATPA